ncbi:hydrogen peroxide-inducible genes activator [Commensalibacter papalotli (ex Botero et al. 2024)]|uniref:LysR family (LysR) (PDB:2FYI) n=1 Tax=Commensalibacter papalotli (ex Botero et al. 2024) TaxID=2972766 RepID=A0ABM9HPN7_9PROT|nr:hydrogen peroxide-inducible genes activator [Commensalibacter papalotli (ex Botero et al. 2024)]CAI3932986.1 DNA-binding transcriptional regulator [Commensalibacter papalotli (ex Botero et al. 2024)]CAI3942696.1 DNA-binding transcriptional regulator [Commensalibacter papalotli (ex Botero et al. 2024)]
MDILPSPQQLRYLIALSEQRHFGRAANVCSVTQSTLSAGILNLERQFAVSILDRTAGKRVVFTPIGEEVIVQAKAALQGLESVRDIINFSQEPFSSSLKLGIIPTIAPYILTPVIHNIKNIYPKLTLNIHEDLTESLMEKLAIGFLDLLIIAMPCDCSGVETYALFKDDFYLIIPKNHILEQFDKVPLQKIDIKEVISLQDGHCLRDQTLDMCRQGQSFKAVTDAQNDFTASSLKTVINMVGAGLGVAFIPKMAIESEIVDRTDIVVRVLDGNPTCRTIGLAWRRNSLRASEFKQLEKVFQNLKM